MAQQRSEEESSNNRINRLKDGSAHTRQYFDLNRGSKLREVSHFLRQLTNVMSMSCLKSDHINEGKT